MPQLTPTPKFAVRTDTGDPAVGWKLWTYLENTSTPKDTYADFGKVGTNTNPIILDSRGEAIVFLDGSYKFVLTDDLDQTIWTIDNIRDQTQNQTLTNATLAGTLTVSSTAVTWSGNPTHSGNHTFSGNVTVNGNTQLGNASSDTLRIDSNTITWTNNPTHSGNHTWSGNQVWNGTTAIATGALVPFSALTPTSFSVANVSTVAVETGSCHGIRMGNVVIGGLIINVDPTSINTLSSFSITPPIASDFTSGIEVCGSAAQNFSASTAATIGIVSADTVNKRLSVSFYSGGDNSSRLWFVNFVYIIQ